MVVVMVVVMMMMMIASEIAGKSEQSCGFRVINSIGRRVAGKEENRHLFETWEQNYQVKGLAIIFQFAWELNRRKRDGHVTAIRMNSDNGSGSRVNSRIFFLLLIEIELICHFRLHFFSANPISVDLSALYFFVFRDRSLEFGINWIVVEVDLLAQLF
jgi:hypothetical protein